MRLPERSQWLLLIALLVMPPPAGVPSALAADGIRAERRASEVSGGQGYRLSYHVNVPIQVFWRFKTDFNNNFLVDNPYIREHRFISMKGNVAVTEDRYSYGPDVFFRWRTTLMPAKYRLDFVLMNPEACHQAYHFGRIQLTAEARGTRVVQEASFDFFGAAIWAYYPWRGGMLAMLTETARWEQATAVRLQARYQEVSKGEK